MMRKMMLKRSVLNIRMLAVVVINFAILFGSLIENGVFQAEAEAMRGSYDLLLMYTLPFATSSFVIFTGLFPGLPYAYSYLEEKNSGYLKYIQTRTGRKEYARIKIFYSGLAGGLSMLVPGTAIFIILDWLSADVTAQNHAAIYEQLMWAPYIYIWGGRFVLFLKAVLLFLFGFMWSELALLFSNIFKNRYVAYVLPFIVYELLWIVIPAGVWHPVYLVRGDFGNDMFIGFPFIMDMIYITLLVLANYYLMGRRDRH